MDEVEARSRRHSKLGVVHYLGIYAFGNSHQYHRYCRTIETIAVLHAAIAIAMDMPTPHKLAFALSFVHFLTRLKPYERG